MDGGQTETADAASEAHASPGALSPGTGSTGENRDGSTPDVPLSDATGGDWSPNGGASPDAANADSRPGTGAAEEGGIGAELGDDGGADAGNAPAPVVPWCPRRATTKVGMILNLDPSTSSATTPWDPASPADYTIAMETTVYDFDGYASTLATFFVCDHDRRWSYHVVTRGVEVGTGNLSFNEDGSLQHAETAKEIVLLRRDGTASPAITLDFGTPSDSGGSGFDGVTSVSGYTQLSSIYQDGAPYVLASGCGNGVGAAPAGLIADESMETKKISFLGNLYAEADGQTHLWTSSVVGDDVIEPYVQADVSDAFGRLIPLDFSFRRVSDLRWEYRIFLLPVTPVLELGSGQIAFDARGRLESTSTLQPLRIPRADRSWTPAIDLDFGDALATGGSGALGVTSLAAASFLDMPDPLPTDSCPGWQTNCVPDDHPHLKRWNGYPRTDTGLRSTYADLNGNLPPDTPLVSQAWDPSHAEATSSISGNGVVFDALGTPVRLSLHFRHLAPNDWDFYLLVHGSEAVSLHHHGALALRADGRSYAADAVPPLRLPLADGSTGPGISLYVPYYGMTANSDLPSAAVYGDGARR